jgi:nucleotide-binding universal stress UspA family protein
MNDMIALRSLLCPVDFSEQSRHALRWAKALARRTKGRLTVLSAVDPLLADAARLRFGLDLVHAKTEPALRQFAAETWSDEIAHATDADFDVRVGNPADVILETAARERTDLIVMGTGSAAFANGSLARQQSVFYVVLTHPCSQSRPQ